ncbi:MAG: antitoxin MazE family protein [Acidithiobacillus ferrivorans]
MSKTLSSAEKVRHYRQGLRAAGMKPVQFWVADPRAPHFVETLMRQCQAINASTEEQEVLNFCEAAGADIEGWA